MAWLSFLFFVVGIGLSFFVIILPLLKDRPRFADFYASSQSFWSAVRMKLNTIKTKLASAVLMIASGLIELHDFLLPAATGLDWTPITAKVPPAAWPILSLGVAALFWWLRKLTANTHEVEIAAVASGATPAQAAIIAEKEPAA